MKIGVNQPKSVEISGERSEYGYSSSNCKIFKDYNPPTVSEVPSRRVAGGLESQALLGPLPKLWQQRHKLLNHKKSRSLVPELSGVVFAVVEKEDS